MRFQGHILAVLFAVVIMVSCGKENSSDVSSSGQTSYPVLRAFIDTDTKTTVDGVKFAFSKDDGITVYNGKDHSPVYYKCTSIKDGTAVFSYDSSSPNEPDPSVTELIATFPRRSATTGKWVEDGLIQILLPVNHSSATAASKGYDPTAIPFVAYSADAKDVLYFKQTCGILALTLKGTATITKATLTSADTIGGSCTLNYRDAKPVVKMTGASKTVNYTYKNVSLSKSGEKFYFGLPPGEYDVTFTFTDSYSGTFTKTAKGLKIQRGVITPTSLEYSNGSGPAVTMESLWKSDPFQSSPLSVSSGRYALLSDLEGYCQKYDGTAFKNYLKMTASNAIQEEKDNDILYCYRYAFDKVLSEMKSTTVEYGTAVIWMLYNSGFIVKTPSVCFGLDVNHRYASQLAPYLDFICVSHSDGDHIDNALMKAMDAAGKPVLSNFHDGDYKRTAPATYNIGNVKITTCISDENDTDLYCTTSHRIFLPEDAGSLQIFHEGDSQCNLQQMSSCLDGSAVDIMILRFGETCEAGLIGTGSGQATPKYVLFSHLEELRHNNGSSPMRATLRGAIGNMGRFSGTSAAGKVYEPFWGERMVWKNGKLSNY